MRLYTFLTKRYSSRKTLLESKGTIFICLVTSGELQSDPFKSLSLLQEWLLFVQSSYYRVKTCYSPIIFQIKTTKLCFTDIDQCEAKEPCQNGGTC